MRILKEIQEKINPVVKFGDAPGAGSSTIAKFYYRVKVYKEELILVSLLVFSVFLGFGLGRLSKITERKVPIKIEYPVETIESTTTASLITTKDSTTTYFVASKNGTKYYFPWCSGVAKISPQNIVKFSTREEAESNGFSKASNCKGL